MSSFSGIKLCLGPDWSHKFPGTRWEKCLFNWSCICMPIKGEMHQKRVYFTWTLHRNQVFVVECHTVDFAQGLMWCSAALYCHFPVTTLDFEQSSVLQHKKTTDNQISLHILVDCSEDQDFRLQPIINNNLFPPISAVAMGSAGSLRVGPDCSHRPKQLLLPQHPQRTGRKTDL